MSDPIDGMHDKRGGGWTGVTPAEQKRREDLMFEDAGSDHRRPEGLVTLSEAVVTKAHSCASIPVAALLSQEGRWSVAPVFGSSDVYFQAYGILAGGLLNTDWTQQPPSLKDAGISGSLNGMLHGTTTRAISID